MHGFYSVCLVDLVEPDAQTDADEEEVLFPPHDGRDLVPGGTYIHTRVLAAVALGDTGRWIGPR